MKPFIISRFPVTIVEMNGTEVYKMTVTVWLILVLEASFLAPVNDQDLSNGQTLFYGLFYSLDCSTVIRQQFPEMTHNQQSGYRYPIIHIKWIVFLEFWLCIQYVTMASTLSVPKLPFKKYCPFVFFFSTLNNKWTVVITDDFINQICKKRFVRIYGHTPWW